tara:strand:- start:55 stop:315 length:261 start_codon:yes stop_codon:yes gene_type:complete
MKLKPIVYIVAMSLSFSLIACSTNAESKKTRALFDTRKEAEKAAKDFNCTGAHKMGEKWMPCKSHDAHSEGAKHSKHGHSGHHHNQ